MQLLQLHKPQIENIFTLEEVASHFEVSHFIPERILSGVVGEIFDKVESLKKKKRSYMILEAGMGTGRFTRPLAFTMEKRYPQSRIVGIDSSEMMIKEARKFITSNTSIEYLNHNICNNLPYDHGFFDASISFYVYHCIINWKQALNNIIQVLSNPKILIFIREKSQWGYYLDDRFGDIATTNATYYSFWKSYFDYRKQKAPLPEFDISASNLRELTRYLKAKGFYHEHKLSKHIWERDINFQESLISIEFGLFTKLRTGLTKNDRTHLKNKMKRWLIEHDIEPMTYLDKIPAQIEIDYFYYD